MTFYFIVSTIALVILIITLVAIGIAFNKPNNAEVFPTVPSRCPDYWTYDGSGSVCTVPESGSLNAPSSVLDSETTFGYSSGKVDFSNERWSQGGTSTTCKLKSWANKYNVKWDGITNYNNCL
jgi:hypothetical protein